MGFLAFLFLLLTSIVPAGEASALAHDRGEAVLTTAQGVPVGIMGEELSADPVYGSCLSPFLLRSDVVCTAVLTDSLQFLPVVRHTTVEDRGPPRI